MSSRTSTRAKLTPYLFLAPAGLVLGLFWFLPAVMAVLTSFTHVSLGSSTDLLSQFRWIGLDNYLALARDPLFLKAFFNSWIYLLGVVPPLVILPLLLAILVNTPMRGIGFFRAAYYLPVVIPIVVVGLTWKWLYAENGLVNYVGQAVFPWLLKHPVPWLSLPETAMGAVMAVTIWKGLGYYMVIYLAGLQGIPRDIYESADLDGASRIQRHLYLTLPLMLPQMGLVGIISCINALKVFAEIWVLTKGGPLDSTTTMVYYLYQQAFEHLNMGYASAIGMALFGMTLALSMLNKYYGDRYATT
ncbi:Lactose transport system permease protein LacF [compost metagenome]